MNLTVAIAAPVPARYGDIVAIYFLQGSTALQGEQGSRKSMSFKLRRAANSPLVYNETARAWSVTDEHVSYSAGARSPGAARVYGTTPDADLPVVRAIRGYVVSSLAANGGNEGTIDTMVTIDVLDDRTFVPGEDWLPRHS